MKPVKITFHPKIRRKKKILLIDKETYFRIDILGHYLKIHENNVTMQ